MGFSTAQPLGLQPVDIIDAGPPITAILVCVMKVPLDELAARSIKLALGEEPQIRGRTLPCLSFWFTFQARSATTFPKLIRCDWTRKDCPMARTTSVVYQKSI